MKMIALAIASVLALAPAAYAQVDPQGMVAAKPGSTNPADKVVCRTDEVVGSRLKKEKRCLTVAQWRELSKQSGEFLDHRTERNSGGGG